MLLPLFKGVLTTVCALGIATVAHGQNSFFAPALDTRGSLDPDLVFPQGLRFPFTFYGAGAERSADLGATMAGRMYQFNAADLAAADTFDVHVVAPITGGWSKDGLIGITDAQIIAKIEQEVLDALAMDHEDRIAWWYLKPEELRYWRAHEINYLELAAQTIRNTDPRQRPVWMYDPGHRDGAELAHTAAHLDIVGKGMYTNYSGQMLHRVWCRWGLDQQQLAIATANPSAISIAVPEMFQHPGRYDPALLTDEPAAVALIQQWVPHDVYAALIHGAQGVAVFAISRRPNDTPPFTGNIYQAYLDAYAQIAGELTGPLNLGQILLFGERRSDLILTPVSGPSTVHLSYRNHEVDYPSIGFLEVAWEEERYLFLVNSTDQTVTVNVSGFPVDEVDFLAVTDDPDVLTGDQLAGSFDLVFSPWDVQIYRATEALLPTPAP